MWVTKRDKARGSDEIIMRECDMCMHSVCACGWIRTGVRVRVHCVCVCAAMAAGVAAMEGYGVCTRRVKVPPGC